MSEPISKAIDPARLGISKSLVTTPCSRQGFYKETVRDASGRRLSFPMPERVLFGKAVDVAHGYIVEQERDGQRWALETAIDLGIGAAEDDTQTWEHVMATESDPETFRIQVTNAMTLFLSQEDGLERLRPYIPGIRIQGNNGRSLSADTEWGTPDIGTPDYIFADDSVLDVKTGKQTYYDKKFYDKPEMGWYAYLQTMQNGAIPPRLIYQVYVRLVKPKWQWIEVAGNEALVRLGQHTSRRWHKGLLAGDPELFDVDLAFCHDCPYRQAIPEVGHDGCAIGQARTEAAA